MTLPDARREADRLPARLRRYFGGRSVAMTSPLAPAELQRRINRAAMSTLWRPYRPGIAGWARLGLVRLRVHGSLLCYYRPVLAGRIVGDAGGSRLDLNFRAPVAAWFIPLIWYPFLALFLFALATGERAPGATTMLEVLSLAMLALFLLGPVFFLHWASVGADGDLDRLVVFLERVAEAKPVRSLAG